MSDELYNEAWEAEKGTFNVRAAVVLTTASVAAGSISFLTCLLCRAYHSLCLSPVGRD